jgi:hypothetical protein
MERKNKEFENHVKEGWCFAKEVTEKILKLEGHKATNVELIIFEKCLSPLYYFIQDATVKTTEEKPTEKQIKYAKSLGIENPEHYSKKEISKKIDEAK